MSGRDDVEALPNTNGQMNGQIHQPGTPVLHEAKSVPEALFRRRQIQFLVICIVLQPLSLMSRSFHWYRSLLRNGAASGQIGSGIPISLVRCCGYG